jgi:hypothetical protein
MNNRKVLFWHDKQLAKHAHIFNPKYIKYKIILISLLVIVDDICTRKELQVACTTRSQKMHWLQV